jgi:hypothetical protein
VTVLRTRSSRLAEIVIVAAALVALGRISDADDDLGRTTYQSICANCHGMDGRGGPGREQLKIDMPDFTDCSFATREPDDDWLAVAHEGGPARGFSPLMPAHGASLGAETLSLVIAQLRSFCRDTRWPRGELNLPRPQITEKAYPEDEAVLEVSANLENETAAEAVLVLEKRIGPRAQAELAVPFALQEDSSGSKLAGIGDVAVAAKYAFWHDLARGAITSVAGEVVLPTGDSERGLGSDTVILEPSLLWGQILPWNGFLHAQLLGEFPLEEEDGDPEAQLRLALGRSFFQGRFGREWAPMVELVTTRVFADGEEDLQWDAAPQLQVALNRRQHLRLSLGARVPLDGEGDRPVVGLFYFLWDWYDGGLTAGW